MAHSIDQKLNTLANLKDYTKLKHYLADRNYRIIGKAADIAREQLLYDLTPALCDAFKRLRGDGSKVDPSCMGKVPICRALVDLDCEDIPFLLEHIHYRQMEPVWGGSVDSAAEIRSLCAVALVASGWPRALVEITPLLHDPELPARLGGVNAIASGNPAQAETLLRLKVHSGDPEPEVMGLCFENLLEIEPDESLPFVARFLRDKNEEICEQAALSLGTSRLPDVIPVFKQCWEEQYYLNPVRRTIVKAASLHRSSEAIEWLFQLLTSSDKKLKTLIGDALRIYSANEALMQRLDQALR